MTMYTFLLFGIQWKGFVDHKEKAVYSYLECVCETTCPFTLEHSLVSVNLLLCSMLTGF